MSNQIELELAANSGPAWLAVDGVPVTVSFPAEAVRFEGEQLCFLTNGSVVRTVPRSEVAALSWRAGARGRPGDPKNAGLSWTDEERDQLTAEVHGELSWAEIARRHERSGAAVRLEAQKLGLVEAPVR
ncbi:SANT/Myb domain-containing protein [Actinospica durhamensis]|uniref:SANT/Myb domain-containing protein n=1 Tax=Actinospica durhamensis TaxID=1508375 RepID=A0A941EZ26_9ACTN|nr:SANT/Myb-like DNA-binding domain-containing protein [Actinospica durhamensis]MBR7837759.1 SANT/Myb domain-containing protein [Actinospica durhamensis]